jgi:peptidoglycan pentaglycine glycine transferase (the first glycine)
VTQPRSPGVPGVPHGAPGDQPDRGQAYQLRLSSSVRDPRWDRFLAGTTGGHHLQSTYWGRVKASLGWRTVRVTAVRDDRIYGGAQVLLRPLPVLGAIGYVALGPVLRSDDPALLDVVLRGVHTVARANRVLFLVVQPPAGQEAVVPGLLANGYRAAGDLVEPHPAATVLIDLGKDEDTLLAGMKKATRYNIRLAGRRGVRVREGTERDVPTFYRLLAMTGRRQGFPIPAQEYFRDLHRIMAPPGHAKLFLAEYGAEPLSAALVIAFGDTVSYKRGAWSGQHRHLHPNELLQWTVMHWAKRQGYRYYDLEGIEAAAARAVLAGARPSTAAHDTVSAFKLGFGGDVSLAPAAYERIPNPALRHGYHWLVPHVLHSRPARWLVDAVRTR